MSNVKGKRVAVLVEKFYEDLELWYPVLRLREAGCHVQIVGPKTGETYASKHHRVPVAQNLGRIRDLGLGEHMRVAPDQLLGRVPGDLRKVAGTALLQQERQEMNLEQHVTELVQELGVVAAVCGVGQLVGLLEGVRHDRPLVLLPVPGALDPQTPGDLIEAQQRRPNLLAPGTRAFAGAHPRPGCPLVVVVGVGVVAPDVEVLLGDGVGVGVDVVFGGG